MIRLIIAILLIITLEPINIASAYSSAPQLNIVNEKPFNKRLYRRNEVLVKFKAGISNKQKIELKARSGIEKTLDVLGPERENTTYLFRFKEGLSVDQVVKKLEADPNVIEAEPNYIRKATFTPNDSSFSQQWGLHNIGQEVNGWPGTEDADIDALEAWDTEQGASNPVTIAVIDTGIDNTHPDLTSKIVAGYNFAGISQTAANLGISIGYSATNQGFAQSIKGTGENLTHIGIALKRVGNPTAEITVAIKESLDVSQPNLASFTVAPAEVSSANPVEIYKQLSSNVNLTAGSTYYVVVQTTNSSNTNFYFLYYNSKFLNNGSPADFYVPDPYRDGQKFNWNGSIWTGVSTDDLYFVTNRNSNPRDDNGHGTHVAGIAAANSNNGQGISGVSPGAKIMPLKAGDSTGGFNSADIIDAIYYAADNGAKIINMSFGGTEFSSLEQNAINYAYGKGVSLFAAVGNDGDETINYPAGYSNVVGVAATDNEDFATWFSNYNLTVDISAPGQDIYSTMPTYPVALNSFGDVQDYEFESGTSMATPFAAGVAALLLSKNPLLTPLQVQQNLQQYANDLGMDEGLVGRDDFYGYGRINARRSILQTTDDINPVISSITGAGIVNNQWQNVTGNPTFTINASDSGGMKDYLYYWGTDANGPVVTNSVTNIISPGLVNEGVNYLNVIVRDNGGNYGNLSQFVFKYDKTIPLNPSLIINGGAEKTNNSLVNLALNANDLSGLAFMRLAQDQVSLQNAQYAPFQANPIFNLTGNDGLKTVYGQLKDFAGNESAIVSDDIVLERPVAPQPPNPGPPPPSSPSQPSQPSQPQAPQTPVITIQTTNLSLKASPKSVAGGKAATIKGQLKATNGQPLAGKQVKIKANGKVIGTATTNANGQFTFKHKPKKTTSYQASFTGDGSYSASNSNSVKVTVKKTKKKAKAKKKKKK